MIFQLRWWGITKLTPVGGPFWRWWCNYVALTHNLLFMAHQLKPCFCLFQRVRDQLYLQPPTVLEESNSTKGYFGALSFTKPLEKLVLCTVSLSILLDWLSKPREPHLVEAASGANPEKALAIGMTRRMLYENEVPLVGVGLVYKPHYIPTESFSTTYMCLNEWHKVGSQSASEDRITSSKLLFVNPSGVSSVLLTALHHPVLLDMASREMLEVSEEPPAPAQLRGFRLHTLWSRQPGGELIRQVGFPQLFGKSSAPLLEYTPEDIPTDLFQSPKIAITLRPPSKDHWNVASDLILPTAQEQFREWREAKRAASRLKEAPEVVEVPPADESAPREAPPMKSEANKEASSLQRVLEITQGILEHIHATRLQALNEMGSTHELDRTLSHALMAEFVRVQLVMGKDLTQSLIALRLELENSSQSFLSDISKVLNLQPTDPAAGWVPLYTPDSLTKYLPTALSAFSGAAPLSLSVVVPPQQTGSLDREFLLTNFHWHACLVRQSLMVGGKRRQLAFCPYCGIINENADMAFSHVSKHLNLLFVCGACHIKSYVNGHAVHRHMTYQCVSAMAILAKPKSSRR